MKACACLFACLLFAVPAQAFSRSGGSHGPGFGRGHYHRFGGYGLGLWQDAAVSDYAAPELPAEAVAPSDFPPPGVIAATIAAASALAAAQGPGLPHFAPPRGPHIIFLGERPAVDGPRVIYGTD
jgi:hypothetical protein